MKIVLIGFMGSGKSSTAEMLGTRLSQPVIEMDEQVLQRTGAVSMDEVFQKGGELLLRETEIAIAKELSEGSDTVVSTGGGVVMNKIIIDYLRQNGGQVVYLSASFSEIATRLAADPTPRPLFTDRAQAEDLYTFREPLYRRYADAIVETDGRSIAEIAQHIISTISPANEPDISTH